jgi:hypothetical protein
MVALDTGLTDGTPDIAQACGAKVERFDWVDVFRLLEMPPWSLHRPHGAW